MKIDFKDNDIIVNNINSYYIIKQETDNRFYIYQKYEIVDTPTCYLCSFNNIVDALQYVKTFIKELD